MAAETIACGVCGAANDKKHTRCQSCGARLEELQAAELSDDERYARRYAQDHFVWKWVFTALAVYLPLEAILLVVLPKVVSSYDPQGLPGILIATAVWFVGGVVIGAVSPGRTYLEPAVAALIASIPTVLYLDHIADVREMSAVHYIASALLGVMATVLGSFAGERIQGDKAAQTKS